GEKSLRGCKGHGRIRSSGTRWTCSRVSGAGLASGVKVATGTGDGGLAIGLPPNNAPRPRPKAGLAMPPDCRSAMRLSIHPNRLSRSADIPVRSNSRIPGRSDLSRRSEQLDVAADRDVGRNVRAPAWSYLSGFIS